MEGRGWSAVYLQSCTMPMRRSPGAWEPLWCLFTPAGRRRPGWGPSGGQQRPPAGGETEEESKGSSEILNDEFEGNIYSKSWMKKEIKI